MYLFPTFRRALVALAMAACVLGLGPVTSAVAVGFGSVTVTAMHNDPTTATSRSGVVFTLGRVADIDPTTAAGQARVLELQRQLATTVPALVDVRTLGETGVLGTISAKGLDDGVYIIREIGISDGAGGVLADPAPYADMVFAIPMLDAQGQPIRSMDVMPKPKSPKPTPTPTPPPAAPTRSASPTPSTPIAPGIDTGGGTEFEAATQWAMVVAGLSVLSASFLATRRRASDQR